MIEAGSRVHYFSQFSDAVNGIVKKINDDNSAAWVVYKCNNNWDEYEDYTGVLTNLTDLREGWQEDQEPEDHF